MPLLNHPSITRGNKRVWDYDDIRTLPVKKKVDNGQVVLNIAKTVLGRQQVSLCSVRGREQPTVCYSTGAEINL